MADVKRNTPKSGSTNMPDAIDSLRAAMGAQIKVTTVSPHSQTLQGSLFTACPMLNVIAVNTASASSDSSATPSNKPSDFHIIPIKHISSFELLSLDSNAPNQTFGNLLPPIANVDLKKLREREEAKLRQLREQERNRGKGVSQEAQAIYDALRRMLPTRWHEQDIIVNDAVIIHKPYKVENCRAEKGKEQSLAMVTRMVQGEWRKIEQRAATGVSSQGGTPPPGAPRKGG